MIARPPWLCDLVGHEFILCATTDHECEQKRKKKGGLKGESEGKHGVCFLFFLLVHKNKSGGAKRRTPFGAARALCPRVAGEA